MRLRLKTLAGLILVIEYSYTLVLLLQDLSTSSTSDRKSQGVEITKD